MFVSSGTMWFPPATSRRRLAPLQGHRRSFANFSVDTYCSGIHFPPDSLEKPWFVLILRPFVIQKTGINNKLCMTESKEPKKKKKWSSGNKWFLLYGREEEILLYGRIIKSWYVYSLLKWITSRMCVNYVEQKINGVRLRCDVTAS